MNNTINYKYYNQNISIKIADPKRTVDKNPKRYVKAAVKGPKGGGKSGPGKYTERNTSLTKDQVPGLKGNQSELLGKNKVVNLSRDEYDLI